MKEWLEYAAVWAILKMLGALPRGVARSFAAMMARLLYAMLPRLRRTAEFNLRLAFPEWDASQRNAVIRSMVRNLGWMAAEFARFAKYTRENIEEMLILEGHDNFLNGQRRGKGVLYLTGHIGAWELSSFARALLKILKVAGTVGILADQNTMPEEGAFVDFFGKSACTTTGIARVALHTDAAVVPGYAYWDAGIGKYRLRFEPAVELVRTGDTERDVFVNTQKFAKVIEEIIRKHPEQWVWVHARWKTRPKGEAELY